MPDDNLNYLNMMKLLAQKPPNGAQGQTTVQQTNWQVPGGSGGPTPEQLDALKEVHERLDTINAANTRGTESGYGMQDRSLFGQPQPQAPTPKMAPTMPPPQPVNPQLGALGRIAMNGLPPVMPGKMNPATAATPTAPDIKIKKLPGATIGMRD